MVWVYYGFGSSGGCNRRLEAGFTKNVGVASTTGGGGRVEARGS